MQQSRYKVEPPSADEAEKMQKMVENGASREYAWRSRWRLRRKRRVTQVVEGSE